MPTTIIFCQCNDPNLALSPAVTGPFHPDFLYILHLRVKCSNRCAMRSFVCLVEQIAGSPFSSFHGGEL